MKFMKYEFGLANQFLKTFKITWLDESSTDKHEILYKNAYN